MSTSLLANRPSDNRKNGFASIDRRRLAHMLRDIRKNCYPIDTIHMEQHGECLLNVNCGPATSDGRHKIYSCTKTIVGVLIGMAVDEGLLDTQEPVLNYFPEIEQTVDSDKCRITVEHVLSMTWGLATEEGGDRWVGFERENDSGLLQRIFASPLLEEPGSRFRYNNSCSHVLCCLLQRITGQTPAEFARLRLFDPLGSGPVEWESDGEAGNTGWSGIRIAAGDLAKIGTLFLGGGTWRGRRLLSEAWISQSTTPRIAAAPHGHYGFHWWAGARRFFAAGIFGQYLIVAPEQHLVAVICSTLRSGDTNLPLNLLEKYVLSDSDGSQQSTRDRDGSPPVARGSRSYRNRTFVWRGEHEGRVADGRFIRTLAPAFGFRCPPRSRMAQLSAPYQVAALTTADEFPVHASFTSIPQGMGLAESGPQIINDYMGVEKISHLQITDNREIALAGDMVGYRTDFAYRWESKVAMKGVIVSAFHGSFRIFLDVHTPLEVGELARIAESLHLNFNPPERIS